MRYFGEHNGICSALQQWGELVEAYATMDICSKYQLYLSCYNKLRPTQLIPDNCCSVMILSWLILLACFTWCVLWPVVILMPPVIYILLWGLLLSVPPGSYILSWVIIIVGPWVALVLAIAASPLFS